MTFINEYTCAFLIAFCGCFVSMPLFIRLMHHISKKGQPIRDDGPKTHLAKKGTPTMGGVMVILWSLIATLLTAPLSNAFVQVAVFMMLAFGIVGFQDDYLKITNQSAYGGISGRRRLFVEFVVSTVAILWIIAHLPAELAVQVEIPYWHILLPLGAAYVAFGALVITGTTNAVNLTDGLDGLVSVPLMIAFGCFGFIAYASGESTLSQSLYLNYIPNVGALSIVCLALIGALLAFLCYNKKPAKIFMGDVGALGLGGVLATMALCVKQELLLAIIGGLFVIEAVSDIIQVGSYKLRKKRVFLMAPIHHHFEKMGWSEVKVVRVFWLFAFVCALLGLADLVW